MTDTDLEPSRSPRPWVPWVFRARGGVEGWIVVWQCGRSDELRSAWPSARLAQQAAVHQSIRTPVGMIPSPALVSAGVVLWWADGIGGVLTEAMYEAMMQRMLIRHPV